MGFENGSTVIDAKVCLSALNSIAHTRYGDTLLTIMTFSKESVDNLALFFRYLHVDLNGAIVDALFTNNVIMNCGLNLPGYRPNPAGGMLLVLASIDSSITPEERRNHIKKALLPNVVARIIFDIPDESDIKHDAVLSADLIHATSVARQWLQADLSDEFRNSVRALRRATYEYMQMPVPPHLRPVSPP